MSPKLTTAEAAEMVDREVSNLAHLGDISFDVRVELGRKRMRMDRLDRIQLGDVIELEKLAGQAYDVRVNDHLFAHGDIVVVTDLMACRVKELVVPEESRAARMLRQSLGPEDVSGQQELMGGMEGMVPIPGGPFVMGSRDEDSPANERPAHSVYLPAYYIDAFPVTNMDYREFVAATGHRAPTHWQGGTYPMGTAKHPVVNVSWDDAVAYAEWRGKRLPTEAEWEKAARGTDERLYPWGDGFVDGERCNSNNVVGSILPVDEFPLGRSPYGAWDMVGNAYEWCSDFYQEDYYRRSPGTDPQGPEEGQERVIRGGAYAETPPNVRATRRSSAPQTHIRDNLGFRLALSAIEVGSVIGGEGADGTAD